MKSEGIDKVFARARLFRMSKKDLNQLAASIVEQATSEHPPQKRSARAQAGSEGGKKGGPSRAAALSDEQRTEIAKKAAESRWKKS